MADEMKKLNLNASNGSFSFPVADQTARDAATAAQEAVGKITIPTTLPNPNKLTFTGGATGEYDGTKAVTINIPTGGEGGGSSPVQYVESLDESNLANLRDLETGTYVLYGYFYPYDGAADTLTCDKTLVSVAHLSAGSHVLVFNPLNCKVNFLEILVDESAASGFTYSVQIIDMRDLPALIEAVGSRDSLATEDKSTIVAAINEVTAKVGSGSGSSTNMNADWDQNDETAADYIKNRPFYEAKIWKLNRDTYTFDYSGADENIGGSVSKPGVWLESVPSYRNNGYGFNTYWPEGCTFCVEFDGVKYEPEVAVLAEGTDWFYIGNPYLAFEGREDNGLPYAIIQDRVYDSTGYLIVGDTGAHTISLYELESSIIKQLDEKFIPDAIARVSDIPEQIQPNLAQNDEAASDYVKNRTHWVEVEENATLLPETTVTTYDGYGLLGEDFQQFIAGEVYRVTFNDAIYDCIARANGSGSTIIGNGTIYGDGIEGNGEPFSCDSSDAGSVYINVETDGEYTISITGNKFTYKTIDVPYLPPEALVGKPGEGRFSEVFNGSSNSAQGDYSHAEGESTTAKGYASHAEGGSTYAGGRLSHAEGADTSARGEASHAEGAGTNTKGYASHAEGYFTTAIGNYSHVQGKYNIEDTDNRYAHIVGNGESEETCSNAHTLDWEGNAWYAGSVESKVLIISSPNGTRYQITVDDNGTLSATAIIE